MTSDQPSHARIQAFADLAFQPRFAFPEMAKVVEVVGQADGTELSGGFARFTKAEIPWQLRYDELILVIEGRFSVETAEGLLQAGPRDTIWLPKGSKVIYRAEAALVFYALQPASWLDRPEDAQ